MILPFLTVVAVLWAGQTAPSERRDNAAQDAPVRTVADAVALLKANNNGPKPVGSPGQWVLDDDYPAEAIRRGEQGAVAFALDVDVTGRVTGCSVTASSKSTVLDETRCRLMQTRASFEPARDARGKAIAGRWSSRFRWELPAPPPPWDMEKPIAAHLSFDIAPDRTLSNCAFKAEGAPKDPPPLCPMLGMVPAVIVDYLRAGSKVPVTVAADFTLALEGAAPLPFRKPTPGVATFAHINFVAEPNPVGRPHCIVEGAWGDYKGRFEFPCPREMDKTFAGKTQVFRMVMTLGSSGTAPDPEGLGPIIKQMTTKNRPESPDEAAPAISKTRPASLPSEIPQLPSPSASAGKG